MNRWAIKPRGHYPKDWNKISKDYKDSVDNTCELCGHIHIRGEGYFLTVHHLDGNKNNNEKWNLIALCGEHCHQQVQMKINMEEIVNKENFNLLLEPDWLVSHLRGYMKANGIKEGVWKIFGLKTRGIKV